MHTTSVTLLHHLQSEGGGGQWSRFIAVYQPFMSAWLRRRGIRECDACDIEQEVFAVLLRELPRFRHNGAKGAFRCWLRRITENQLRKHRRKTRMQLAGDDIEALADRLANESDPLSRQWDQEHDDHLLKSLVHLVRADFNESTIRSFELMVFEERSPSDVAATLGLSKAAVIAGKARVLRRLREEARRIFEPEVPVSNGM
ncbi:MAG: sigma-70 family RNA polymerase sigma factor [Planctomycetota bacterium]